MTLEEVAAIPKEFLTAMDIAPFLGCDPHNIRVLAHEAPERLLFPVIVMGTRVKIPKHLFIQTFKGEANA